MTSPSARTATEQRTIDVEVEGVRADGRTLRGHAAVFGVLSEDLGGFRERIAPGAFADVLDDDVRLLVDHEPPPLARTKAGTLRLHEDERGLAFEADLPDTTAARDLRESVSRGDVDGASFRFVVGEEEWQDDVRTIVKVAALRDVTVATYPAYPAASIELRSRTTTGGERRQKGAASMDPQDGATAENTETTTTETETTEQRSAEQPPAPTPVGSLRVEERTSAPSRRALSDEFRSRGWPHEAAEIPWETFEQRAITWSPSVNLLGQIDREASPYPFDERYLWSALPREQVDSSVTSVQTLVQVSTTADTVTGTVRAIDAVTPKAEVASTLDLTTTALSGVAAVESDIPTIVLEQPAVDRVINRDLTVAVNNGLDELAVAAIAASDNETPGANHVISIRAAITTLQAAGYAPDLVVLDPTSAEELDLLVSGLSGGTADFVFGPGQYAGQLWSLRRVVSKAVSDPVVLDSRAFGRLYVSPARLTTHEQDSGLTNKHRVRLELNAAVAVERQDAAIRLAAS